MTTAADAWLASVVARHAGSLSPPEFLKAVRALSVRYVERRAELPRRPPTDSAGKRAAFAGFFAPLHFLTTRAVVESLGDGREKPRAIVDLGCGTGVASAAWAATCDRPPDLVGIDRQSWALTEARWNWRTLGLEGRTRRADLGSAAGLARECRRDGTGVILAWTVNELAEPVRNRLLPALLALPRSVALLVIEPLAHRATPWWDEWSRHWQSAGGRSDEWRVQETLPPELERLREAAGFRRTALGARSLWLPASR